MTELVTGSEQCGQYSRKTDTREPHTDQEYVAESVLGEEGEPAADAAHMAWLLDPENIFFAWSDQMVRGVARGSKYYPRGVTSWLWLNQ